MLISSNISGVNCVYRKKKFYGISYLPLRRDIAVKPMTSIMLHLWHIVRFMLGSLHI